MNVAFYVLAFVTGIAIGGVGVLLVLMRLRKSHGEREWAKSSVELAALIEQHFHPVPLSEIIIAERRFPYRVRADLQRAVDRLFDADMTVTRFSGVRKEYSQMVGVTLADCLVRTSHDPAVSVPPQYEEIDIGEDEPVRCLKNGLWFVKRNGQPFVVLLAPVEAYGETTGVQFQVGTVNRPEGDQITRQFFKHLEEAVLKAECYRGKILSLEQAEHSYHGEATGITVHRLRTVHRDEVILPAKTLELLERNVVQFVRQRRQLSQFGLATTKGILFYGPPGTGKTHTIHYLATDLKGHTMFLISAEQVGLLGEYMTLARLLQPSVVVIEDVDLIASERTEMGFCEQVLLNSLLNEMDGLKEDSDTLFILTTNRPESIERALASRPGRIDQAIEFPLPDDEARAKLVRLYSRGVRVTDELVEAIVHRTDNVSAAFIKELMRRSFQFHLERGGNGTLELRDVENALDEMLIQSGSLNLTLLGAEQAAAQPSVRSRKTTSKNDGPT